MNPSERRTDSTAADEGRKRALQQDIAQFNEQIEELQKSIDETKPKVIAAQKKTSEKQKEKVRPMPAAVAA